MDALAIVAGAFTFKNLNKELRFLVLFLTTGLVITILSIMLGRRQINNLWLFHLHTLLEFVVFIAIYSMWIPKQKVKISLRISIVLFIIYWILAKIFIEDVSLFDNITSSLNSGLLTIVSGYFLVTLLFEEDKSLIGNYKFWITVGVLVYYSGCLIMFALSNQIFAWQLHSLFSIISKLLFCWGFITAWRQ